MTRNNRRINLYSDTQTLPTEAMRQAMATAPVGDEQRGEDPSVNRLCERVAELLGKTAAVFLPSGTMCNEIAILVHCRPGDEIIADRTAHIMNFEGGAPGALAGVQIQGVAGVRGVYGRADVEAAVRMNNRYFPRSRLVAVEQTANLGGGTVWPVETLTEVGAVARRHGLATHMDGARLMNAVLASGRSPAEHAQGFDSVWIDLSKGLGCPVGAVLAGSAGFIEEAWRWKQRLGGAMRQAGILAAAGLYALDHHVDRLADDHANARRFADGVAAIPGVRIEPSTIQTNIVFFELEESTQDAAAIAAALEERGILIGAMGPRSLRAVTHLDVTEADVDAAVEALAQLIATPSGR